MTALAKCKDCRAITLDTEDDARAHREWHRDLEQKLRNTRSAAIEARDALGGVRSALKDLRDALDQQPAPIEPDEITVTDMRDDDELGLHDPDEQPSHYADDEAIDPDDLPAGTDPSSSDYAGDGDPYDEDEDDTVQPAGRDPLREYFTGPTR